MAIELVILTNFSRFLLLLVMLIAIAKIVLMSRDSSWDGWSLLALSLSLLSISAALYILEQYGLYFGNIRPLIMAVSGVLAALAFTSSTVLIKKESGKK